MEFDNFTIKIKGYLDSEVRYLDKNGGVTKIDKLTSEDLGDYLISLNYYPELSSYVLENGEYYDLFLRYRKLGTKENIGGIIESAYKAYCEEKYQKCIGKLLLVLRKAACPSGEVYGLLGLAYGSIGDEEKENDYIRLSNYILEDKKYNIVDIKKTEERVEEKMKNNKKNNYNQFNYKSERNVHIDGLSLPNIDEIIDYIESKHIDLETAGKELHLTNEQTDIIKLIYAREFYKQGDIEKGNYYLNSVEKTSGKTSDVTRLCLEARSNKLFFQYRENNQPKKLSLVKTGRRK